MGGIVNLSSNFNFDFCAVLQSGVTKCWGDNGFNELGNGTSDNAAVATAVKGLADAAQVGSHLRPSTARPSGEWRAPWYIGGK